MKTLLLGLFSTTAILGWILFFVGSIMSRRQLASFGAHLPLLATQGYSSSMIRWRTRAYGGLLIFIVSFLLLIGIHKLL